jgi:hypothetical protein
VLYPVFRELLQNSDDANAKAVEIHFDTEAYVQYHKDEARGENGSNDETAPAPLPDLKQLMVSGAISCSI